MQSISVNQSYSAWRPSIPVNRFWFEMDKLGFVARTQEARESLETMPPEVVFIAPAHDTIPSPVGNAIYVLVERLCSRLPQSCAILARWPRNGEPTLAESSRRILYYRASMRPTFLERRLPYRLKMRVWGHELLHQLDYAKAAGQAARRLEAKLVIVEDTPAFCPAVRSSLGREGKVLLHQHCDKTRVLHPWTWRRLTRHIDGMVFVAEKGRRAVERRHGRMRVPQFVVYCGVDLEHYSPAKWTADAHELRTRLKIAPDSTVLLYAGRLVPEKGIAEAAEAFNLARVGGSHMIIAGSLDADYCRVPQYVDRLRSAVWNSAGRISMVGAVSQQQMPAYYQAAQLVILPSIASEGLPKVIIEALAMGRPVIASDRGGMWELLNDKRNAWLLRDPAHPAAIAETLKAALDGPEKLQRMGREILALDRPRLSEQRMINEFAEVVTSFIGK